MNSFRPDFLTAFGMTALAAFTVSWVMWILGRQHWRQGMSQAVLSTLMCGVAYTCFALQSKLGIMALQVTAKILISVAIAAFTIALQRFRQSTHWPRDWATIVLPIAGSLFLAALYVPKDLPGFNRMQTVITVLQTFSTLQVLYRMRPSTPGIGWTLVTASVYGQILSIVPLVFVKDRPSPGVSADMPLASLIAMWALCLVLFLKLVVTSIGFLIMLRDRQAALEQHKAMLDPLTQLNNRTALIRDMTKAMNIAARNEKPLSVMIMDIDHFKRVNDKFGHLAGDQVIQLVARVLQQQSRGKDVVSRYGGEEFVLVLPDTLPHEALIAAQRMCRAIRNTPLVLPSGEKLNVTVSVGIFSDVPVLGAHWEPMVEAADAAMYRAKRSGRDRVVISASSKGATPALVAVA
ncbi:GGDEF domain-containing protein [Diaphorobacter sp. HDW4A]|uniref:GGDEF domain-containing protein n=1 Tax=Diaphorobacter sp. HDW4A TaxID=2714924 RepID=UPI001408E68C|nr:GGDEF domain-containing protein [Diaphorobacter sp. HDW4A]QIL83223.1 GGDEF domain-containing protein [Diaphorobacter sp. HDW4A]